MRTCASMHAFPYWDSPSKKDTRQGMVTGLELLGQVAPDLGILTCAQGQEGMCS
jgi:hypothetical protein